MKKYKIGYTTGVFDLFHIGHLNILKKSKEFCDYLIVGVSTDELVLSYKNKLPIIPFSERIAIVEAIKYVDKVIPQLSLDKTLIYNQIKFDVLFHGNDWSNNKLYLEMEQKFNSLGVDVIYFDYTKGVSSTELTKKISEIKK